MLNNPNKVTQDYSHHNKATSKCVWSFILNSERDEREEIKAGKSKSRKLSVGSGCLKTADKNLAKRKRFKLENDGAAATEWRHLEAYRSDIISGVK